MFTHNKVAFLVLITTLILIYSCKTNIKKTPKLLVTPLQLKKEKLSEKELENWYHKDYLQDTIPGISLDKAYKKLLKNKKGTEVIVAVIDTKLDIYHDDLKQQIWTNTNEVAENGIDDDKNGYIDDINGWDFTGNKNGEFLKYSNFSSMRVIRKYDSIFKGKSKDQIDVSQQKEFLVYQKAKKDYKINLELGLNYKKYADNLISTYLSARSALKEFFPEEKYHIVQLDSLYKTHQKDTLVTNHISYMQRFFTNNNSLEKIEKRKEWLYNITDICLNYTYNERAITGDNPEDITDIYYGYNQVWGDVPFQHSTSVAGVIAANRNNNSGIKGMSDSIKIMPIVMVSSGDEHDKDVAIAIRYAVDNGAHIINMSWGKYFSIHEDWVIDAIKYAAEKNVLLVTGAGNDSKQIDEETFYPNDYDYINNKEITDNFINVAANTSSLNKDLIASFSNYGKLNVDIFAPGNNIYTTAYPNDYKFSSGTSLASPLVAGVAALLKSYYPKLTASQLKKIILQSGTSYNIDVELQEENGTKTFVPFSSLSKSGKIVNAYNALLMAEKMYNK